MRLFILIVALCAAENMTYPELSISLGKIKGSMMRTRLNKDIYAFRGLRYAESPVGKRRFEVS